ncbi:hypothetical protein K1719_015059 [Acacia pycnantha]|nr:hypothetical protein K1719_015059 [Acacia pycnantha]
MTTGSYIGISTMKPCGKILRSCKSSSLFGFSPTKFNDSVMDILSKSYPKSVHRHRYHTCNIKFCRGISLIPNAVSDFRNHSTSVDSHVNDTSFEKIYIQSGLNVKPLVFERIENGQSTLEEVPKDRTNESNVNIHNLKGLNESKVEREVSEIEKEAWKLLRGAVFTYCGNPVGTVAANDPADKQPLNYDQIFIRDFVPSAIAFLLNGEGEIVKNFLLHTLQLQSWEKTVDCYSPGQGLMPASFKVRTVSLDGSNEAFEEVLDPDFGESAIGRVAPVDSDYESIALNSRAAPVI